MMMGILDIFKRSTKPQEKAAVGVVRKELFTAIQNNHFTDFETLCLVHEAEILANFAQWKNSCEELRSDPDAYALQIRCLQIIADYFLRKKMKGELHEIMTGLDDSEATQEWRNNVTKAQQLMSELKYAEALEILQTCLERGNGLSSTGVTTLRPLTLGCIGECYMQLADAKKAIEPMQNALALVEELRDSDSVLQYLRSLYEIHRYLDEPAAAAVYAQRFSEILDERGELIAASNWRHQSRSMKSGEPPLRVVVKIGDELFELNDIPVVQTEKVEFLPMRSKVELRLASQLCEEGKAFAEQGDVATAVSRFESAAKADPCSYLPYYYQAAIYMHKGDWGKAVEAYEKAETLCPGWENTRSELWLAKELAAGRMKEDAYKAALIVGNNRSTPEQVTQVCRETLDKYSGYAECYLWLGKIMVQEGKNEEALEQYRKGLVVAEDPDVKSRLLVNISLLTSDQTEKISLLKECAQIEKGNIVARATAIYLLRQIEG